MPDFNASAQLDSGAMQPLATQWRPAGFFA